MAPDDVGVVVVTDMSRRATDAGEPTNAELMARIDALGGELHQWISEHRRDHTGMDQRLGLADVNAAIREQRLRELEKLPPKVEKLDDFRVRIDAYGGLLKAILGTSLVAAAAGVLSIIDLLSRSTPK